ncbi:MAG: hypothetical protein LDL33_12835 [Desulfomonile sp.]|nr:hypothetical protein [Desulfomonile sp.]
MRTVASANNNSAIRKVLAWVKTRAFGKISIRAPEAVSSPDPRLAFQSVGDYFRDGFFGLNGPFGLTSAALDVLWAIPAHLKPPALSALENEEKLTGRRPEELQAYYNDLEDLVFDLNQVYIDLCEKGYLALLQTHFTESPSRSGASQRPAAIP